LLGLAVVLATALDDAPAGEPRYRDRFRLVAADFHVHAFPGDGALAPWDLRREARRRRLDAIAITNHNQTLAWRIDRQFFPEPPPPLTLPAEELTAPGYHVAAIGIREPVDWRLPFADAIRAIHAQGGIAIAAHPAGKLGRAMSDEVLALLDGIEVAHPARRKSAAARDQIDRVYARAVRIKPTIAPIGSSDYHANAPIGSWRTLVLARDLSQEGILDAVREGRTVAVGESGRTFGRPELVALVDEDGERNSPPHHRWQLAAAAIAWLALIALVTAGRRD
jgi:hypothetical protein